MSSTRTRPSMTRRHFDAIAQAIAGMQGVNIRERFARTLVPALQQFNEYFDEERFVQVATGGRRVRRRSFSHINHEIYESLSTAGEPSIVSPRYGRASVTDDNEEESNLPRSTPAQQANNLTVVRRNGLWAFASSESQRCLIPVEVNNLCRGSIADPDRVILPIDRVIRWVVIPSSGNANYENLWGDILPSSVDGGPPVLYEANSVPQYYYTLQRPSYIQQQISRYLM